MYGYIFTHIHTYMCAYVKISEFIFFMSYLAGIDKYFSHFSSVIIGFYPINCNIMLRKFLISFHR